jgi:hypothetical protein
MAGAPQDLPSHPTTEGDPIRNECPESVIREIKSGVSEFAT